MRKRRLDDIESRDQHYCRSRCDPLGGGGDGVSRRVWGGSVVEGVADDGW